MPRDVGPIGIIIRQLLLCFQQVFKQPRFCCVQTVPGLCLSSGLPPKESKTLFTGSCRLCPPNRGKLHMYLIFTDTLEKEMLCKSLKM